MLDLDKFKSINDKHGHPAGDQVLRVIGKLLKTAARATDLAARYGGEEMVLCMPATGRAGAAAMAEMLRRAISARPVQHDKTQIPVTASIGVAVCEPGSAIQSIALLVKAADLALYNAKHSGRNCVRVFSPKPSHTVKPAA
jgi:diguanylate cyclase (GGDEF)-like protein